MIHESHFPVLSLLDWLHEMQLSFFKKKPTVRKREIRGLGIKTMMFKYSEDCRKREKLRCNKAGERPWLGSNTQVTEKKKSGESLLGKFVA